MTESLAALLADLPETSLTTRALDLLDLVVPGEWTNVRSLEALIIQETGEDDPAVVQAIGERAIALYADPSLGYQRAVELYRLVDHGATVAGVTALAGQLAADVSWLSFLGKVTPKPETAQAVDAALKLACEVAAFVATQGLPGDGVGDFLGAVGGAAREDKIRLAAWALYDGVLPLGPDFLTAAMDAVSGGMDRLEASPLFGRVRGFLPGGDAEEQRGHIQGLLGASTLWVGDLVQRSEGVRGELFDRVKGLLEGADDKLDYAAAILDLSTNIFEHTGIQTVARRCVRRAYAEV